MPDAITDERARAEFARLRADELSRLVPPGADAVRRTVRRRRTRTTVAGAALTAAVLLAAAGYPQWAGRTGGNHSPASGTPADLGASAAAVIARADGTLLDTGQGALDTVKHIDDIAPEAGTYLLHVLCLGRGSLDAVISAGSAETARSVPCEHGTDAPEPATLSLRLTGRPTDPLTVTLQPDAAAIDGAGFAYGIEHRPAG
ncbi:MAG TPA: hypothetical protein VES42_05120 [Pilimelia sp.]|nr:hypothetical protein [Pilimelia sp.]